jgi:HEPN domain-containing protein
MHRALTDGRLTWTGGSYPLDHVVLAGELLYTQGDYVMSLKSVAQVKDIAAALARLTREDFERRYRAIDPKEYGDPLTTEDCESTWEWLQRVRALYERAARAGRQVLFTVDQ